MGNTSLYGSVVLGILGLYALKVVVTNRKRLAPLPPGPKELPFIGNATAMPPRGTREWEHWIKHKELYGTSELEWVQPTAVAHTQA
jgi:predicted alpha/beta hydrolase